MKEIIDGTTYNTDTSTLVKAMVIVEDLTNGYIRYKTMNLYYGNRIDEFFLAINKTTTDMYSMVIDVCEYIVPVDDKFVYNFGEKVKTVI